MADNQEVMMDFGDYELILGNEQNNTLTGTEAANIFVHQGATNYLIKNYNPSENIIVLTAGKVSETIKSSDGNDTILKISDGDNDLGTITIQGGGSTFHTVYDAEYVNRCKEDFLEFSNTYIKSVVKTFEEDEEVQSILTDGENSAVLAEIKTVNPELAAQIANVIKLSYETGVRYLESGIAGNSSSNANIPEDVILESTQKTLASSNYDISALDLFNNASSNVNTDNNMSLQPSEGNDLAALDLFNLSISTLDCGATVLQEVEKFGLTSLGTEMGTEMSKVTHPVATAANLTAFTAYNMMLYDENIVPAWQNQGHYGGTPLEKLARIRSYNPETFDGTVKSTIGLVFLIGGSVAVGMCGAPVLATATVCFVVPIAWGWAYDTFTAPQLDAEEKKLEDRLKDNFNNFVNGTSEAAYRWLHAINTGGYYREINTKDNIIFYGTPGRDSLRNEGDSVFIASGTGDDYIDNWGHDVRIVTGAGNDTIGNSWRGVNVHIITGAGNDSVSSHNANVTVDGGPGNDTIGGGSNSSIDAGEGNNHASSGDNSTIKTGAGDDTIGSNSNSSIDAGEGNNYVSCNGDNSTIKTGSGNDRILAPNKDSNSIDAGEGNNTVRGGRDSTIKTGAGNDSITSSFNSSIEAGEGNNTVEGSGTIKTGTGDDHISVYGGLVYAGEGNNDFYGYSSTIKTGSGNDRISIYGGSNSLNTGAGDDLISFFNGNFYNSTIDLGEGNNTVDGRNPNYKFNNITIKADSGDDLISIYSGSGNSIYAGEGNNTVKGGSDSTIRTGAGDDSIRASGSIYAGEGNNTIIVDYYSYNENNNITINNTIKTGDGDDYISSYGSSNNSSINNSIDAGEGNNTVYGSGKSTIHTGAGDDSIYGSGFIDADEGNNTVIGSGTIKTGDGDDFITSGSESSIDAGEGNNIVKGGSNSTIRTGAGNDSIHAYGSIDAGEGNNTVIGGGTIKTGYGNDFISIYSGLIYAGEGNNTVRVGSNSTIKTGYGDDFISIYSGFSNSLNNSIDAGEGNNTVIGSGGNSTIRTGAGDDLISIYSGSIDAGEGNNTVYGSGTIKTSYGDDFVSIRSGSDNSIDAGEGNNTVIGSGTIKTGSGNDYISGGSNNSIDAGNGNDYISGGSNNFIDAGNGNNTVQGRSNNTIRTSYGDDFVSINSGSANSIDVGEGNNTVLGSGNSNTINTGSGDDFVSISSSSNNLVNVGEGNNTVRASYSNNTINTGSGDDFISIYGGSNNLVDVGEGNNIILVDYNKSRKNNNNTIKTGSGDDFISIYGGSSSSIDVGSDNSIDAGEGNNTVLVGYYYNNSTIKTGSGDDYISTYGNNNIIYAGDGNNYIETSYNSTITTGNGNDTIIISDALDNVIDTGDGDDVIVLSDGGNNLIDAGRGKNTIIGYDTSDTLQINDSYLVTRDNDDVLISFGANSIRLENFAEEEVNINGKITTVGNGGSIENEFVWELEGTEAIYKQNGKTLVTVSGVKSVDGISLSGTTVKLSAASLGTSKITVSQGYTLELADDVPKVEPNEMIWSFKNNTATLNSSSSAGYSCDGKTVTYTAASSGAALATITGVNNIDGIKVSDGVITLPTNSLGTAPIKLTKGNYTLALADENLTTATKETSWIVSGTKASYKNFTSEYYSIASNGKSISYVKAAPDKNSKDFITLNGVNKKVKASDFVIDDENKTVTLSANALNKNKVTIGGTYGYSLALADDVTKSNVSEPTWSLKKTTATLNQNQSVGYVCNDTAITYLNKAATVTLATITGVNNIDGIEVNDGVITLPTNALGTAPIKLTKGNYTLALADENLTTATKETSWIVSGTKASYKNFTSEYYSIASNGKSISYVKAAPDKNAKDFITLNGVNKKVKASDFVIDDENKTVTLYANALNKKTVTIGGTYGYSLALADDVTKSNVSAPTWSLKKTTATLSQNQSVGYVCDGATITYSSKKATVTLATITGVNSISGIKISGNVITLPTNALGTSAIKLMKGNYTLALADKNLTTATKETSWIISGTKASYKNSTSEYYSIAANGKSISYVKAAPDKNSKDFITLNGVNKKVKASDFVIDDENKTVTLSANALNKKNVTIGGTYGYSLALADDVTESAVGKNWSIKSKTATLQTSTTAGYSCDGDKITYTAAKNGKAVATISGVKKGITVTNGTISGITVDEDDKIIMLSANALGSNKVIIGGSYEFDFAADYNKSLIIGSNANDSIKVSGTEMTVKGGKGDDSLWGDGGADTFVYAKGDGRDVIYGFDDTDMLEITGKFTAAYDSAKNAVSFNVGSTANAITLKDYFTAATFNVNGTNYQISGSKLVK